MILSMFVGLLLLSVPSNASCEEVPLQGGTRDTLSLLVFLYVYRIDRFSKRVLEKVEEKKREYL